MGDAYRDTAARSILVGGREVPVDSEGYLINLDDWSEEFVRILAREENLTLTDEHWQVVRFIRDYYQQHRVQPQVRVMIRHFTEQWGAQKGSNHYLHEIFPKGGPQKQGNRLAGIRRTRASTDRPPMAIRIRSRFHAGGRERTMAELAGVVAMLSWKLAIESIKRMREAKFDIDLGRPYFDYVCESMAFHAHMADRVAHGALAPERRNEFTTALARCMAEAIEDNADMLWRRRAGRLPPVFPRCVQCRRRRLCRIRLRREGAGLRLPPRLRRARARGHAGEGQELGVRPGHGDRGAGGCQGDPEDAGRPFRRRRETRTPYSRRDFRRMILPAQFDLDNATAYAAWRNSKLATHPRTLGDLVVELADPRRLTLVEREALLARCGTLTWLSMPRAAAATRTRTSRACSAASLAWSTSTPTCSPTTTASRR
jgi:tRNA 2-thiouridine synthesizing protein E